jgi:phage terminase large subunit-like protein
VHRAHAVVPTFAQGMIYAPDRSWADKVIDQCESFPKGKHDDLVDSTTMAIEWLRKTGNLASIEDENAEIESSMRLESPKANAPLYPGA